RGKVGDRDDDLKSFATALTATTGDIPSMFPEGSDFGETDALEKIWEDWDAFEKAAKKADSEADALLKASESGDAKAVQKAFKDMSEACKGCHKKFRAEEE
ncbi:MAG: cytochrome c, partial [Pseudomonadota bacterium]|nr:cytochrome c [Pseudomonadota bacterium]